MQSLVQRPSYIRPARGRRVGGKWSECVAWWLFFQLLGKRDFLFGVPAGGNGIVGADYLGRLSLDKRTRASGREVACDFGAARDDSAVGEMCALANGATIANEDLVTDFDITLPTAGVACLQIGKEMEVCIEQLTVPREAYIMS